MRTLAALFAAAPLLAAAQAAPPPQTWTTDPPAAVPAGPQAAPAAQPAPASAPPPQAAPSATATVPPPQYPPPPQAMPPAAPQPPPSAFPAPPRPQKARDRWYIGFGVGSGDGKIADAGGTMTFKEAHLDESPATLFMNFKVGATLSPKLLLGLDIGVISSAAERSGVSTALGVADVTTSLGIVNLDAMATFFPTERGFFLKGGFGRSALTYTADAKGIGKSDTTASGWNVAGGVGYAWWLGKQYNLTATLELSRQWYEGATRTGPFLLPAVEDSQFWSLWLGFDWY